MRLVRRHRRLVIGAIAVSAALLAFVLAYFEPQKLFIDDEVHEALPAAAPAASDAPAPATAPARGTKTLSNEPFRSHEHASAGRVRVLELADGRRYVRFEDFSTSNGPALKVYLSAAPPSGPGETFDDRYVDLGDLKGNIGEQNYAVPRDVELEGYRSVVVWCERFSVAFAAAAV